jgi:hypothetical protein
MVHTIPPMVDKVETSSAEAHIAQVLVDRSGSKAPDDNPTDDDPVLLNFTEVEGSLVGQAPGYRCTGPTKGNWTVRFDIPDGPVFMLHDASLAFHVLGHDDVRGDLWVLL